MLQKIFKYTFIAGLVLSLCSCEDFFKQKPHDKTEVEDILKSERDAVNLVNGMYMSFKSGNSYGTYLTSMLDATTDVAFAAVGFSNTWGDAYAWRLNPGSAEPAGIWGNVYGTVFNCNTLINGIHAIEMDEDKSNGLLAQAHLGRALVYHNLVRVFAKAYNAETAQSDLGIPYITEYPELELLEPERNTVEEVYQLMIEDIKASLQYFEDATFFDTNNYGFNEAFANGLAARIYLDMQNYEMAIEYAEKVMSAGFSLATTDEFRDIWLNDRGNEIIWKVQYSVTDFGAAPGYNFFNRNNVWSDPNPDYIPANWWVDLYETGYDVRGSSYITNSKTLYGWTGDLIYKYPTNPDYVMAATQGTNMPKVMRLAEMYLILAEAEAKLDDKDAAIGYLETLLKARTGDNEYEIDPNVEIHSFIAQERKKELMFEGFYWFDLKRRGEGFERVPQAHTLVANDLKIEADDYRWQWPIPRAELNGNPNIEQNPGY
ncbi:RagB/SusD family nutrient uptake outer membrane protein [Saccharicrinis aurantiacus]|uniref:RagB/SusD family nutrient uptake outer membrane protein n=1 Tax=Saccharicrinis aurantiacus TaxID=1849719 RepID=UPI0015C55883|nr:RagB/SusD family nutrient uptake outer membrane protein [Saccharicrinis aurantiacus]